MVLKPCLRCGRLSAGSYCPDHARGGSTRSWRRVRQRILRRDQHRCQLCGAPADDVDHIVKWIDGGSDDPSNLRAICSRCNRSSALY